MSKRKLGKIVIKNNVNKKTDNLNISIENKITKVVNNNIFFVITSILILKIILLYIY